MKKNRESNYELLRIISIIMIIMWHIIVHGNVFNNSSKEVELVLQIIKCFSIIHVNLFILITGYYQYKQKIKPKKIVNILLQVVFYSLIISTIFYKLNIINQEEFKYKIFTILYDLSSYWYISVYIIVYLLSPYINRLLSSINKVEFKKLLLTIIIINIFIPYLTQNLMYDNDGYTIMHFITMYLIGAYINKYHVLENLKSKINNSKLRTILIITSIALPLLNLLINNYVVELYRMNFNTYNKIFLTIIEKTFTYNNPLVVMQAVVIFLLFGTIKLKNEFINTLASTTIGVYIIHENIYIRSYLYKFLGLSNAYYTDILKTCFLVIATTIMIYTSCVLIDIIRKLICYLLENKTTKIEQKFYKYLSNLLEIKET